jgi:hypothetical protein
MRWFSLIGLVFFTVAPASLNWDRERTPRRLPREGFNKSGDGVTIHYPVFGHQEIHFLPLINLS